MDSEVQPGYFQIALKLATNNLK